MIKKKIKTLFFKNFNNIGLVFLTVLTILISYYFNYQKKSDEEKYNNFLPDIVYQCQKNLPKTLKPIIFLLHNLLN